MKFISAAKSTQRQSNDHCTITEFPMNDNDLNFAIADLAGRYPESGRVKNLKCKEIVYIAEGSGKIVVNGHEQTLKAGDVVMVETNEPYFWEGTLKLLITCHPAFSVEQHVTVE